MHLGRFNSVVEELSSYFDGLKFDERLAAAITNIQTYASNRDANTLAVFRAQFGELALQAELTPSSFLLPSVSELLADLTVDDWVGAKLAARLRRAVETQGLLPDEIASGLSTLKEAYSKMRTDIGNLDTAMSNRSVEYTVLSKGEAEFGIAFPRELVGETAAALISEFEHVNRLFMALNEFMGRGTESPRVRTIASSWWQLFIELDTAQITLWTVTLERIVAMLKSNYEIKKLKKDLEDKKHLIPENFLPELEEKLVANIKKGVTELAAELRALCPPSPTQDIADLNELEIRLKHELLHLVRRVNGGAVLEIRIGNPAIDVGKDASENVDLAISSGAAVEIGIQNAKLADLSALTAKLDLRSDLFLDAPIVASLNSPSTN